MVKATKHDKALVVQLLTKAFNNNRSVNYIIPQDKKRLRRISRLMAYSFEVCSQFGDVLLSDDRKACALILYHEKKRITLASLWRDIGFVLNCIGPSNLLKVLARESKIQSFYPPEPFTYLWFIGLAPENQKQGIGSRLLQEIITESHRRQRAVYLETSTPENLPWYQKNGFEIYHEIPFGFQLFKLHCFCNSLSSKHEGTDKRPA